MSLMHITVVHIQQPAKNQRGMDGKFEEYYGGGGYALTFSLARLITFADMQHSAMYSMYVHVVM